MRKKMNKEQGNKELVALSLAPSSPSDVSEEIRLHFVSLFIIHSHAARSQSFRAKLARPQRLSQQEMRATKP